MRELIHQTITSKKWITIFVLVVVLYYLLSLLLHGFIEVDDQCRFLAKLLPTAIVIITIIKSRVLRSNSFQGPLLSGIFLSVTFLLVFWSVTQMAVFRSSEFEPLTFHIYSNVLTASFEDGLFRVILFVGLVSALKDSKWLFWKAASLTALVFAALHLTNAFRPDFSVYTALTQVVFAFGIGVFLQVIYVVTRNILIPISIHFLINFFGSSGTFKQAVSSVVGDGNTNVASLISTAVFCAVLIGLSALLYRKEVFDKYREAIE